SATSIEVDGISCVVFVRPRERSNSMTWQTINPASGSVVASYEESSPEAVQAIIAGAHQAYLAWRSTSFRERSALMRRAAEVLRKNAREYARLMAEEMGKPIRDGTAEIQKCAVGCDYYA